jgi:hypothetical protein
MNKSSKSPQSWWFFSSPAAPRARPPRLFPPGRRALCGGPRLAVELGESLEIERPAGGAWKYLEGLVLS